MTTTAIVYGPQACGKTSNSAHILKHFSATKVVDDWNPKRHRLIRGAVHLTTATADEIGEQPCQVVAFDSLRLPAERRKAPAGQFVRARSKRSADTVFDFDGEANPNPRQPYQRQEG